MDGFVPMLSAIRLQYMLSCYVSLTLITRQIGEVTFKIETRLISIHLGLVTATLGDSWQSCWLRRCEQLALLCTCTLAIDHLKTCPSSSLKFERPAFNIQSYLQMAYPRAIVLQFYHEDCGKRFHHTFYFDRTPPGTWTLISQQVSSWTLIVWLTSSQPRSGSIRDVRDYTTTHVRTSESMPMRAMFWLSLGYMYNGTVCPWTVLPSTALRCGRNVRRDFKWCRSSMVLLTTWKSTFWSNDITFTWMDVSITSLRAYGTSDSPKFHMLHRLTPRYTLLDLNNPAVILSVEVVSLTWGWEVWSTPCWPIIRSCKS